LALAAQLPHLSLPLPFWPIGLARLASLLSPRRNVPSLLLLTPWAHSSDASPSSNLSAGQTLFRPGVRHHPVFYPIGLLPTPRALQIAALSPAISSRARSSSSRLDLVGNGARPAAAVAVVRGFFTPELAVRHLVPCNVIGPLPPPFLVLVSSPSSSLSPRVFTVSDDARNIKIDKRQRASRRRS